MFVYSSYNDVFNDRKNVPVTEVMRFLEIRSGIFKVVICFRLPLAANSYDTNLILSDLKKFF